MNGVSWSLFHPSHMETRNTALSYHNCSQLVSGLLTTSDQLFLLLHGLRSSLLLSCSLALLPFPCQVHLKSTSGKLSEIAYEFIGNHPWSCRANLCCCFSGSNSTTLTFIDQHISSQHLVLFSKDRENCLIGHATD